MNLSDTLILYTDTSTRFIGDILMQVQGGRENIGKTIGLVIQYSQTIDTRDNEDTYIINVSKMQINIGNNGSHTSSVV